jgi:subtilisin family serine protease
MNLPRLALAIAVATSLASAPSFAATTQTEWVQAQNAPQSIHSILSNAPTPIRQQLAERVQSLQNIASTQGRVRVIIQLNTSYTAEGKLASPTAVQTQRSAIQAAQSQVLANLPVLNASQIKRFDTIPFMALSLDASTLAGLLNTSGIVDIQQDRQRRPSLSHSVPLIGGNTATTLNITGQGQTVAVLDTGVDKTHPFLAGKVVSEACYSTHAPAEGATSLCPGQVAESTASGSGLDCNSSIEGCGHGTHVAGIVAGENAGQHGVAPKASLIAMQVFTKVSFDGQNCTNQGGCASSLDSDQIKALERVYALRQTYSIAAVNMSLGGGNYDNQSRCDEDNLAVKAAIDQLRAAGIATVIASGNEGIIKGMGAPGCISSAISIGSSVSNAPGKTVDTVSDFSNSANYLDLLVPGESINSSTQGGGYASWNGTSMATPHAAGVFALLKQAYPAMGIDNLELMLKARGKPILDGRNGFSTPRIDLNEVFAHDPIATRDDIAQIYIAGFLRGPELAGLNYWYGERRSAQEVADVIFSLPIVKAIYPDTLSNTDFVTAIYRNVFGREPDSGGLNYWRTELANSTRGRLVLNMIRAGLGTPDGTAGKSYVVNRTEMALYAITQQRGTNRSLEPEDLKNAMDLVNGDQPNLELGKDVIDRLIVMAR